LLLGLPLSVGAMKVMAVELTLPDINTWAPLAS
jgi:hypothetical protein